jgi:hypothetical protein
MFDHTDLVKAATYLAQHLRDIGVKASFLPDGSVATYAKIYVQDDTKLSFYVEQNRVVVSLDVLQKYNYSDVSGTSMPSISFSPKKTYEVIARDIKKRLLDVGQDALKERREKIKTAADNREALAKILSELEGLNIYVKNHSDCDTEVTWSANGLYMSGRAKATGITIDRMQSMSMDKFKRILAIMRE